MAMKCKKRIGFELIIERRSACQRQRDRRRFQAQ
jgi:hypothetical protein